MRKTFTQYPQKTKQERKRNYGWKTVETTVEKRSQEKHPTIQSILIIPNHAPTTCKLTQTKAQHHIPHFGKLQLFSVTIPKIN